MVAGGNPNLNPENSYGYYAGAVWSPGSADPEHSWWGWVNGFSAYVDWYQITIRNLIGTLSAQQVIHSAGAFQARSPAEPPAKSLTLTPPFKIWAPDGGRSGFWFQLHHQGISLGQADIEANAAYIYNFKINQFLGGGPNGKPKFNIWDQEDSYGVPDFKAVASLFYSKQLFGIDTFRTGLTFNYVDSEHDINDDFKGTNPSATLDAPKYVHLIGSSAPWTGKSPMPSGRRPLHCPRHRCPDIRRTANGSSGKRPFRPNRKDQVTASENG